MNVWKKSKGNRIRASDKSLGISPYPLNNRRFTCLLVPPKGVHSTISNIGRDSRY